MGFLRWTWKHSATRQLLAGPPKPKPAMTTVGGVTHRLVWADRNAGWRYRCSCGWIDAKVRWTETNAINEANRHVRAARRGGGRNASLSAAAIAQAGLIPINASTAAMLSANAAMRSNARSPSTDRKIAEALAANGRVATAIANGQIFGEAVWKCQQAIAIFQNDVNAFYAHTADPAQYGNTTAPPRPRSSGRESADEQRRRDRTVHDGKANPYDILGLSPDASGDEIGRAYKALIYHWHPDRNNRSEAAERSRQLTWAFNELKDPEGRKTYAADFTNTGPRPRSATSQPAASGSPPPSRPVRPSRQRTRSPAPQPAAQAAASPPPPTPKEAYLPADTRRDSSTAGVEGSAPPPAATGGIGRTSSQERIAIAAALADLGEYASTAVNGLPDLTDALMEQEAVRREARAPVLRTQADVLRIQEAGARAADRLLEVAQRFDIYVAGVSVPAVPNSLAAAHDRFRAEASAFAGDLGAALASIGPGESVDVQPIFDRITAAMSTWTEDVQRSHAELSSQLTASEPDAESAAAAAAPSSMASTSGASIADEISKLARLRSEGALDDAEFAIAKSRLINGG